MITLHIPATTQAPEADVEFDNGSGFVWMDGRIIGQVWKGSDTYRAPAAGHSGRVIRYSMEVTDWSAIDFANIGARPEHEQAPYTYRGNVFPNHYKKNSRKAAIAYLVAVAHDAENPKYFIWSRA